MKKEDIEYKFREISINKTALRDIWAKGYTTPTYYWEPRDRTYSKPIYIKHDDIWWKVFAVDWGVKEMLIVEELDETKIPNDLDEQITSFVISIINYNKSKMLFRYYREKDTN